MCKFLKVIGCGLLALPLCGLAEQAPVVDASSSGIVVNNSVSPAAIPASQNTQPSQLPMATATPSVPSPSAMTPSSPPSVDQVAQQVAYLQQLNLPAQIQQLQQQVQDLRGIVESQGHQLEQLQNQLRSQYADLNSRVTPTSDASKSVSLQDIKSIGNGTDTPAPASSTAPAANTAITDAKVGISAPAMTNDANIKSTKIDSIANRPATDEKETQAYTAAFDMIKNKKYSEAIQSFNDYLQKFPAGQYVAHSHYWLGELYALSGANDKATNELTLVATNFPTSEKAPNAMLKLGNMAYEQSHVAQAKEWWSKIAKQFPTSAAARVANARMQQMERAGQ